MTTKEANGTSSITLNGKTHSLATMKDYLPQEFKNVFEGAVILPGGPYHIKLNKDYTIQAHTLTDSSRLATQMKYMVIQRSLVAVQDNAYN